LIRGQVRHVAGERGGQKVARQEARPAEIPDKKRIDKLRVAQEPDGTLDLIHARYEAVDDRKARVSGATWRDTTYPTIKLEGACKIGERAVLLCGSADPRFIAQCKARGGHCEDSLIGYSRGADGIAHEWKAFFMPGTEPVYLSPRMPVLARVRTR